VNYRSAISVFVAVSLALTSSASIAGVGQHHDADRFRQVDRDRNFDRDRDRSEFRGQPRDWDRLNIRDPFRMKDEDIYGHEFMTSEERQEYRHRLGNSDTPDSLQECQTQHEALMQKRALERGGDLVPPGQGPVYGGELMTVQERNRFREQLRRIEAGKEHQQFLARHRDRMNERARALGYEIKEVE
jgi:hypothetical protein